MPVWSHATGEVDIPKQRALVREATTLLERIEKTAKDEIDLANYRRKTGTKILSLFKRMKGKVLPEKLSESSEQANYEADKAIAEAVIEKLKFSNPLIGAIIDARTVKDIRNNTEGALSQDRYSINAAVRFIESPYISFEHSKLRISKRKTATEN